MYFFKNSLEAYYDLFTWKLIIIQALVSLVKMPHAVFGVNFW